MTFIIMELDKQYKDGGFYRLLPLALVLDAIIFVIFIVRIKQIIFLGLG